MTQPRVFITLGRTGQVVERGGTRSNSTELRYDTGPRSGNKRPVGDAFRIYPDNSIVSSKRQREDGTYWDAHENGVNVKMGLTANDLRLKLMRRRSKQIPCGLGEHRKLDHRQERLAKSTLPSASNNRFHLWPEAKESFHPRQISYTQNSGHIHQVDTMQKLNSSCIENEVGARPSDTLLNSSRAIAPLTSSDVLQQFPSMRETDVLTTNGVFDASRPSGFTATAFKSTVENARPVTQLAPMDGIVEKSSQGVVPLTVSHLLHSLGLGKYEILFRAEEVDMIALKQMGDKDLKDLGIPMGPRKKILLALLPSSKQQPPQGRNSK